jgi:hypothetical protein
VQLGFLPVQVELVKCLVRARLNLQQAGVASVAEVVPPQLQHDTLRVIRKVPGPLFSRRPVWAVAPEVGDCSS